MFATSKSADAVYLAGGDGVADAIDFDGTNDYLSRASDLVGNVDGKTFTFSCWAWINNDAVASKMYAACVSSSGSERFAVTYAGYGSWSIVAKNSANNGIYYKNLSNVWPKQGWNNIIWSVDLANPLNHYAYINDVQQAGGFTTYTNDVIDFTNAFHCIAAGSSAGNKCNGRLAHLFLDYTYRDLSIEANRRLFITADRKPALNQQALNPIIYLPLNDQTQPGLNLGTGGNFSLTGTVAKSGRGPSQFNAPYSDLDGSADYLSRTTALAGIADGKQITFACCVNADTLASTGCIFSIGNGASNKFTVAISSGNISIYGIDTDFSYCLQAALAATYVAGRNYQILFSCDLFNSSKRHAYINGQNASPTWSTYNNANIDLDTPTPNTSVGVYAGGTNFFNGRLGNVFFDTKYIDLSVPANLAKFVTGTGIDAKPVDLGANGEKPFGTPPLIYLPMYGNNAGKNYGSGGDFSVQSGPFAGARGPNEFLGNKADFVPNAYLYANTNLSLVKSFSASFYVTFDDTGTGRNVFSSCGPDILNSSIQIQRDGTTNKLLIACMSGGGATVLYAESNTTFSAGTYYIQLGIDLSDTGKRKIFSNGVEVAVTYTSYSNTAIASTSFVTVGCYCSNNGGSLGNYLDGKLSEFYFTTDYIDFSQEANRLKFRDAFGNPVALTPQIKAGTLPNPTIYMRFDPANQGKNYGTGGDFTKTGTINDGGQL